MGANQSSRLLAATLAVALVALVCRGEEGEYGRERYDIIVDRSPFGADPLTTVDPNAVSDAAVKALEKELRLCFLLETESGDIRAGFQNLKAKPGEPKSVMLMVGESFRAMKLSEIDLKNSSATLQYQGKPVTFALTKGTAVAAATPARPAPPARRIGGGFRQTTPPETQEQPEVQPPPEVPVLSPEEQAQRQAEVRENLQRYQMEVIRSGMPPLPIPLTQEMDDQLVAEGVLEPVQ